MYVGTCPKTGISKGVYRTTMNARMLAFSLLTVAAETADPSFLASAPDGRTLLAVNEWLFFEGDVSGALSAFRHDTATGALTAISPRRSSHGNAPRHAHIDRRGRYALVANYVGGSITVLPIAADGSLGNPTSRFAFGGTGRMRHGRNRRMHTASCSMPTTGWRTWRTWAPTAVMCSRLTPRTRRHRCACCSPERHEGYG